MLKLVFKNWLQFGEFMDSCKVTLREPDNLTFETTTDDLLVVYWHNNPTLPYESLVNFTEWFEQN